LTPVVYIYMERFQEWLGRRSLRRRQRPERIEEPALRENHVMTEK